MAGCAVVEKLAKLSQRACPSRRNITRWASAVLTLGVAEEYRRRGSDTEAAEAATRALRLTSDPELACECLRLGASEREIQLVFDPLRIPIGVGPNEYLHDATGVRTWVAAIELTSVSHDAFRAVQAAERIRLAGEGWYRCWLRFVIELADAAATLKRGEVPDLSLAWNEFTRDTRPFRGNPRACYLFAVHNVIRESLEWALSLLKTEEEWRTAIRCLTRASRETSTRMDREDGGPIPTYVLLDLLLPYCRHEIAGPIVRDIIEDEVKWRNAAGTYYSTHADYCIALARARNAAGLQTVARSAWNEAAIFLCGYGSHKDGTIFEFIDTTPVLASFSRSYFIEALSDLQPLTNAVLVHTDHRGTNHAPNAWYKALVTEEPALGGFLLARTITTEGGTGGWPTEQAIHDFIDAVRDVSHAALTDALLATLPFSVEHEGDATRAAEERITPIRSLALSDPAFAKKRLRALVAQVQNDGAHYSQQAVEAVSAAAQSIGGQPTTKPASHSNKKKKPATAIANRITGELPFMRIPPFPPNASFIDLLTGIRRAADTRSWDAPPETWEGVVLALKFHFMMLAESSRTDDAERLLRYFARHVRVYSNKEHLR